MSLKGGDKVPGTRNYVVQLDLYLKYSHSLGPKLAHQSSVFVKIRLFFLGGHFPPSLLRNARKTLELDVRVFKPVSLLVLPREDQVGGRRAGRHGANGSLKCKASFKNFHKKYFWQLKNIFILALYYRTSKEQLAFSLIMDQPNGFQCNALSLSLVTLIDELEEYYDDKQVFKAAILALPMQGAWAIYMTVKGMSDTVIKDSFATRKNAVFKMKDEELKICCVRDSYIRKESTVEVTFDNEIHTFYKLLAQLRGKTTLRSFKMMVEGLPLRGSWPLYCLLESLSDERLEAYFSKGETVIFNIM